jgi:hypothetical protein
VDLLPSGLLLARPGSVKTLPPALLEGIAVRLRLWDATILHGLRPLADRISLARYLAKSKRHRWVVYAKRPFAGPQHVLDYVGRYTHRVAISNNRLLDIEEGQVRFKWKDYRHGDQIKTMALDADEFIRRFLMHVLPTGFQRIRYYGFLGHRHRSERLI